MPRRHHEIFASCLRCRKVCGVGSLGTHILFMHERDELALFWGRVDKNGPGGCWLWKGYKNERGYGLMSWKGEKNIRAHRFSWELVHGHTPSDRFCLHKCDVRNCVNPDHIFLGSYAENAADCKAKDRHNRGDRSGRAKLTEDQALEIKRTYVRYAKSGPGRAEALAARFGVKTGTIQGIGAGRYWAHLK